MQRKAVKHIEGHPRKKQRSREEQDKPSTEKWTTARLRRYLQLNVKNPKKEHAEVYMVGGRFVTKGDQALGWRSIIRRHWPGAYTCCGRAFNKKESFVTHVRRRHQGTGKAFI